MAGEALRFDLHTSPSLEGLSFALSRYKGSLDDLSPLWHAYGELFTAGMREQFSTQGEWGAGGWADLSEAYAKWKASHASTPPGWGGSAPIGWLYGHLFRAMTGGEGYAAEVGPREASFGLESGPAEEYGRYFAERRPLLAFPATFSTDLGKAAHEYLFKSGQAALGVLR